MDPNAYDSTRRGLIKNVAIHIHALVFEVASHLPQDWMNGINPPVMMDAVETIWSHMHPDAYRERSITSSWRSLMFEMFEANHDWMNDVFGEGTSSIHEDFRERMPQVGKWALLKAWRKIHPIRAMMEWTIVFGIRQTEADFAMGWYSLLNSSYSSEAPFTCIKRNLVRSSGPPPTGSTLFEPHTTLLFAVMCMTPLIMSRWQSPYMEDRSYALSRPRKTGIDPWYKHADNYARPQASVASMLAVLLSLSPVSNPTFWPFSEPFQDMQPHTEISSVIVAALVLPHLPIALGLLVGSYCLKN